ncbi:unnamed protein product [Prunus brigantina]
MLWAPLSSCLRSADDQIGAPTELAWAAGSSRDAALLTNTVFILHGSVEMVLICCGRCHFIVVGADAETCRPSHSGSFSLL